MSELKGTYLAENGRGEGIEWRLLLLLVVVVMAGGEEVQLMVVGDERRLWKWW